MGFISDLVHGFAYGLSGKDIKEINEILEGEYDDDDYNTTSNYRDVAAKYTHSNKGWYTCPKCGKKFRLKDMDSLHYCVAKGLIQFCFSHFSFKTL